MIMYKQLRDPFTNQISNTIFRISDSSFIPSDPINTDYQEYLIWVSQGNAPIPPDPILESTQLTPEQKLQQAGLTVEELKSLLGI